MNDDTKILQARAQLDRAVSNLDSMTTARLRAARLRALAAADARRARFASWLPLSSAIAATLVAVTVATLLWSGAPEPLTMTAATEDAEWLLVKENPELFNDQLEFYDWLADNSDAS